MNKDTTTAQTNAAALGGIDLNEPKAAPAAAFPNATAEVPLEEMIRRQVAAAISVSPEVLELKAKLKAAEEALEAERAKKQLVDNHNKIGVANESRASTQERWGITLDAARDKNEIDPVPAQPNGRMYQLKRGQYIEVPREVIGVLNDAVQTITTTVFDERTGVAIGANNQSARRFPYRMHGKAVDATGKRLLPEGGQADHTMD